MPRSQTSDSPKRRANGTERRRFERVPVVLSAIAECGERYLNAFVHDISPNGLQLRFTDEMPAGPVDHILLPKLNRRIPCKPVWRAGTHVGVTFTNEPMEMTARMPVPLPVESLSAAA